MERLLPHAPPMVLLDEALGYGDDEVATAVTIRADHPFATADGVPVHVGIELMAQTCGVYVGAHALACGEAVKVGFLLGTRRYRSNDDWFRLGDRLEVRGVLVFRDEQMAVFDCRIERDGGVVAEAQLSVYQPNRVEDILSSLKGNHG
jgi:predicted hotdog family 3-hydroxylacyl-ACP dehydratase